MKPNILLMNFTHVYEQERFIRNQRFQWLDCTDLNGTDCYCDEEAALKLKQRMESFAPDGIHFIDSGNYHYVSKFWTDKIREPFSLVVFDHHPDMQPSLFEEMLSCGSWVKAVIDTNPFLQKVLIVGADERLIHAIPVSYSSRVKCYSEASFSHEEAWCNFSREYVNEPVYISVDKDVLNKKAAVTNWDQGKFSLAELEELLAIIFRQEKVIGVDICGETTYSLDLFEEQHDLQIDSEANRELLNWFLSQTTETSRII